MKQEDILHEILQRQRKIDELQVEINTYVFMNRKAVKLDSNFEDDYTESIESYYINF